jgi:hypothetical protein
MGSNLMLFATKRVERQMFFPITNIYFKIDSPTYLHPPHRRALTGSGRTALEEVQVAKVYYMTVSKHRANLMVDQDEKLNNTKSLLKTMCRL